MEIETLSNDSAPQETPTENTGADQSATPQVDGKSGGEAKANPGGAPGVNQTQSERYKIKYGKNERELTLDELKMMAQKGWASDDRFQKAAALQKKLQEAVKQANWDELIRMQGKDPIQFYKEQLKSYLKQQNMTPEEKAAFEMQQRIEALKKEEQEHLTQKQERQIAEQEAYYTQQWDQELSQAIQTEGLPQNQYCIGRAVAIGQKVVAMGLDPDWTLIVKEAKRQIQEDVKGLFGGYKDDSALLGFLGDELGLRVSKAMVARKAPQPPQAKAVETSKSRDGFKQKEAKIMDMDSWFEERRKKFGG